MEGPFFLIHGNNSWLIIINFLKFAFQKRGTEWLTLNIYFMTLIIMVITFVTTYNKSHFLRKTLELKYT